MDYATLGPSWLKKCNKDGLVGYWICCFDEIMCKICEIHFLEKSIDYFKKEILRIYFEKIHKMLWKIFEGIHKIVSCYFLLVSRNHSVIFGLLN